MDKIPYEETHHCESNTRYNFECVEIVGDDYLELSANGEYVAWVKFCPFCGYEGKEHDG